MSEHRGVLYKTRWEILLIAASLIASAVTVAAIPNDFTEKMLAQQKAQKEAEERNMEATVEEQMGFTEAIQGNMTEMNSPSVNP
jgi:hypothetical protein